MSNKSITVYAEALKRQQQETEKTKPNKHARLSAHNIAQVRDNPRDIPLEHPRSNTRDITRDEPRMNPRGKSLSTLRDLPAREEIQAFSFSLRDEITAKVQAHVPYKWQGELDKVARELNVKKLELYRFIIGEFLCKVKRKGNT